MRRISIIVISAILAFITNHAWAENVTADTLSELDIPLIIINTVDGETPSYTMQEHPDGAMGTTVTNATKVPASMLIIQKGDTLYDSGDYVKDFSGLTINVTGNTSVLYGQTPYKLRLEKKANLLIPNDEKNADKDWRLLGRATNLNTVLAWHVSAIVGMAWTPQYGYCNVILNGEYKGCYILTENVKAKSNGRVEINKNSGYLIERDAYWWGGDTYFASDFYDKDMSYRWTFKYPDDDELNDGIIQYIQGYVNALEARIFSPENYTDSYTDYLDVSSAAKWLMVHDIIGTRDSGGANMYYAKVDNSSDTRLTMPVIWDADASFETQMLQAFSRIHTSKHSYFPTLLQHADCAFVKEYCAQWKNIRETLYNDVCRFLSTLLDEDKSKSLLKSIILTQSISDQYTPDNYIEKESKEKLDWLSTHIVWLDKQISSIAETYGVDMQDTLQKVCIFTGPLSSSYTDGTIQIGGGQKMLCDIRWRGATSLRYDKKSFAIKLKDAEGEKLDTALLGMRYDNSWILDAMAVDKARMRNKVSMDLWLDMSTKPYYADKEPKAVNGTRGKFVEVWLNGKYEGLYCLTEKIDRKQLKLKKHKDGNVRGILYKSIRHNSMNITNESEYLYDNSSSTWSGWEMQYPDVDDDEPIDWSLLTDNIHWLTFASNESINDSLHIRFDLPVWKDLFLMLDMILGNDNASKNQYVYAYDMTTEEGSRLSVAPWDMDATWGRSYTGDTLHADCEAGIYHQLQYHLLYTYGDSATNYRPRYEELRRTWFTAESLKNRFHTYFSQLRNAGALQREEERWNGVNGIDLDFDYEEEYIDQWIDDRLAYLDNYYYATAIKSIQSDDITVDGMVYNLSGTPVGRGNPYDMHLPRGIYICNRKKIHIR